MRFSLPRKPKYAYITQHLIHHPTQSRSAGIRLELSDGTTQYFHNETDAQNFADLHGWQLVKEPKTSLDKKRFYEGKWFNTK